MNDWNLPTFDGDKGRTIARKMIDSVGGEEGIRTKIITDGDGSTMMLRTRNGFPEITRKKETQSSIGPSLPHGLVVDVKSGTAEKSVFFTKGVIDDRAIRSDVVQQTGVKNYFPDKVEQVYSMSTSGNYLWDLQKTSVAPFADSTQDVRYGNAIIDGASELSLSFPILYNNEYLVVTPLKVAGRSGVSITSELSVADIGSEQLTANATIPLVSEDGSVHLSAYKTLVISPTFNLVQYRWSGIKHIASGSGYSSDQFDATAVSPVVLEISSTEASGIGAFDDTEPSVWWKEVSNYPSGFSGAYSFQVDSAPLGTTINTYVGGGVEEMFTPGIYSESGWHFKEEAQRRCDKSIQVDTQPLSFNINANYDFIYSAQRASMTERVNGYDSKVTGFGYPLAYVDLHTINFTQNGNAQITAKIGDVTIELLNASGAASASGADNRWERVGASAGLPFVFPEGTLYYFIANGKDLPAGKTLDAMIATFDPMPSTYPAIDYFGKDDIRTEVSLFGGTATCNATGFFVIDCDLKTSFITGIECVVNASASFSAEASDGIWDYGENYKIPHAVEIYFVWIWRGVKSRRLLASDTVTKRPVFPMRLRPNPFLPDYSEIPLVHLTFPEFKMGEETFDQLQTLRNHQGVNPCYAGYSEAEEAVASDTGVAYSTGNIRPNKSGAGMVYHRVFAPGDLANCVWLLNTMKISEPISLAPLETDPAKTRPYGFSDILYNAILNTEYKISLLDGVESDWSSTLTADPSATFTCKRV